MRGDEARIVEVFHRYLEANGWQVEREQGFIDLIGKRGDEELRVEVKGRTAAIGLDVDTMYASSCAEWLTTSASATRSSVRQSR